MELHSGVLMAVCVLLAAAGAAAAPAEYRDPSLPAGSPVAEMQSFEEAGVPAWAGADKGKLSVSDRHAQDGRQSLRWDWVPGDRLTLKTGPLGNIAVSTGYGGYSRSAFTLYIRPETARDAGALTFRWMAGEKLGAHFDCPLVLECWQRICYHYGAGLPVDDRRALQATDRIVVLAPATGEGGTVYLDAVSFNQPVDYRGGSRPVTERWRPKPISEHPDPAVRAPATPAELAAVAAITAALRAPGKDRLTEAQVTAQRDALVRKYDLKRHEDGHVTGKTVPGFSAQMSGDLLNVAHTWLRGKEGTDPKVLAQVEETYFLLDDFFRECGAVAQGSMDGMNWYGGRSHAEACFLMAEPLRRTGRLARVRNCLKWFWNYDKLAFEMPNGRQPMGMDYFHIDEHYLLRIALMHDDPQEVVENVRAYTRRLDRDLWNSIEADGSMYHHGFHYPAYAIYTSVSMGEMTRLLAATPFAFSRATYEKVRMAALNMRWWANLTDIPLPMHGRHPGRQCINPGFHARLAEASAAYNGGKMDPELVGALLRLAPEYAKEPRFAGFAAEAAPQGDLVMNYAGIIGHRRDGWLAQARGYGKYYNAFESYAACNRRGLFLGNGYLSILGTGNPVNIVDSGCDTMHGWDWRHLDGCTTYEAPLEVIANGNGTLGDVSDVGFVGGLSHRGTNGLFVMPLHSARQYAKGLPAGTKSAGTKYFAANKTYFFFDRRIVCLGSDISLPDLPYPVQTTLFQNTLKAPAAPIQVDAAAVTDLPYQAKLDPGKPHALADIQGNGYYLPAGQAVTVLRRHQHSFAGCDDKPTEGDAATAIVEHGVNPTAGRYAYFVLPKTTPETLAAFAREMAGPEEQRPIRVLRQDSKAHIVYDRASKSWGCVFFAAQEDPLPAGGLPVAGVSQACLVMAEQPAGGELFLSICDPDLHRQGNDSLPVKVTVTLKGIWSPKAPAEGVVVAPAAGGRTVVTVTCQDGKTVLVELRVR